MKTFMNIKIPHGTALQIHDDINDVMEIHRMSFVENKPLTLEQWRKSMNLLTAIKVALHDAVRKEESND